MPSLPQRIFILHARHRELGGEDVVVHAEAALLASAGHVVEVHEAENPSGRASMGAFVQAPWNVGQAHRVGAAIDRFKPDVVHIHNTWFALSPAAIHAATSRDTATVMTLHNYRLMCADGTFLRDGAICTLCAGHSPSNAVRYGCYRGSRAASVVAATTIAAARIRHVYERVDRFIAPTDLVASHHVEAGVLAIERVVVKPHFIADPGPRTGFPGDSDTFVFAGRIAPGKGVERILEAWRQSRNGAQRLTIIGDGPLRATLQHDAPNDVDFVGFLPLEETRRRIRDARALLFGSEWLEPFGMVLIEAISNGTPVIGFDTGDTNSIVGPGGALVATGDVGALAHTLGTLTSDQVNELGALGRAHYLANFTPELNLTMIESIFEAAIRSSATRRVNS